MFTGLVETLGTVHEMLADGPGRVLVIHEPKIAAGSSIGDSIAINGTCLTVVAKDSETFRFQAGPETLEKTNLGELAAGDKVNLERSLRMGDTLGGHLVQGHIDGVGTIRSREPQQDWDLVWFSCPTNLAEQMVPKGSVAVDGVSLTIVDVDANGFSIALIPHTLSITTLGAKKVGDKVNLETDILGKYVWKYVQQLQIDSR